MEGVTMQAATIVWITATMIHDEYAHATALHDHLVGGDVAHIRDLRSGYADWPMVDLWARVPASVERYERITHARKLLKHGPDHKYADGQVGW